MAQPGHHIARTGLRPGSAWPVSSVMPPLAALPTAPSAARAYVRAMLAEVWDEAPGVPVCLRAGRDDESGRGLGLVDMITGSQWGWRPARSRPGKCVWAVFEVSAATDGDN
jgi:hypothetical protein